MRRETAPFTLLLAAGVLLGASPSEAARDRRTASVGLYLPDVVVSSSLMVCTDVDDPNSCTTLVPHIEQGALRSLEIVLEYVAEDPPVVDATAGTPLPAAAGRMCRQKTGAVARLVLPKSHRTARLSMRLNGKPLGDTVTVSRSKNSAPDNDLFAPGVCY